MRGRRFSCRRELRTPGNSLTFARDVASPQKRRYRNPHQHPRGLSMTDEASFLTAIAAAPNDTNLPLIFADWLDDQGDPRGQWIRNWSVRQWMMPTYENPVPKILESLA